jgi:hypothetical protein
VSDYVLIIKEDKFISRKYGMSFSWKRALGFSGAKARFSRKTRIPLSRSGRQRKAGSAIGCSIVLSLIALLSSLLIYVLIKIF